MTGYIDFPNMETRQDVELLEDDTYLVKIKKWERVKGKKAAQIRFYGEVVKGLKTGDKNAGKPLLDHLSLSDSSHWRIGWFIHEALQINTKELPKMGTNSEIFDRLLNNCQGRKMYWEVFADTYEGKTNNKTSSYIKCEDEEPVELDLANEVPAWVQQK